MNPNRTTNRAFFACSFAMLLGCMLTVSGAVAGDNEPTKEVVTFQDLNLNTPAGAQVLYARIHGAAMRVCHVFDAVLRQGTSACVVKAESRAIQQANVRALTAYYQTMIGRPRPRDSGWAATAR